jgi:hypothetical protein
MDLIVSAGVHPVNGQFPEKIKGQKEAAAYATASGFF